MPSFNLPSSLSDDGGRYAYDRQPSVCRWNLGKLSEALSPCLPEESAKEALKQWVYL